MSTIDRFVLRIEPDWHPMGSYMQRRARITIEAGGGKHCYEDIISNDSFESELEYFMRRAGVELKEHIRQLKKDEEMRSLSVEQMQKHIKERLSPDFDKLPKVGGADASTL